MINTESVSRWFSLTDQERVTLDKAVNSANSFDFWARSSAIDLIASKLDGDTRDTVAGLLIDRCQLEECFQKHITQQPYTLQDFDDYRLIRKRSIELELVSHNCCYLDDRCTPIPVAVSDQDLKIAKITMELIRNDDWLTEFYLGT